MRRLTRGWLFAVLAVVLVGGSGAAADAATPTLPTATKVLTLANLTSWVPSGKLRSLVFRDGQQVIGIGAIYAAPGRPVRFCDPNQAYAAGKIAHSLHSPSTEDPQASCTGAIVRGADLHRLANRFVFHGAIFGEAAIEGIYRRGVLTVTAQRALSAQDAGAPTDGVPYRAPKGGWARTSKTAQLNPYMNTPVTVARRYQDAHPGTIFRVLPREASPYQQIVEVLTYGNPAPVRTALAKAYPRNLCVAKTAFTTPILQRTNAAMLALFKHPTKSPRGWVDSIGSAGEGPDGQPAITITLAALAAPTARLLNHEPPRLIEVRAFLRPAP